MKNAALQISNSHSTLFEPAHPLRASDRCVGSQLGGRTCAGRSAGMQGVGLASRLGCGTAELRSDCVTAKPRTCCRSAPSCQAAQPARQVQPPQSSARTQQPAALRLSRRQQRSAAHSLSYKDAGVDIDAGNELVQRIRKLNPSIGGFAGTYPHGAPHNPPLQAAP